MTFRILAILAIVLPAAAASAAEPSIPAKIQFNRDVRPILSESCFACHGPDKNKRKADLRLDTHAGLLAKLESGTPVVPGKPADSLVFTKTTSKDPDELMPPPASKKPPLNARQIAILKKWIEQGADWEDHWSFTPVKRPEIPVVKESKWVRNPVDAFILARLEKEGLQPSAEADKATLIRRVTLDLTGLPPTPKEVDDFLADNSPDAYEKVVDRLLSSVRFAERLTMDWLDAARYADTHGYHIDSGRDMTRRREWVIESFHQNKPYDQFTVEQLAGDLLPPTASPNATLDQKIASGFNRNNMVNFEGGAFPEEYRTAYVIDRVNTTGTVWLGLTVGCTQCHDHKFDPITQKEFYQLFAYFNQNPEKGLDGQAGNAVPFIATPTVEQEKQIDALSAKIADLEKKFTDPLPDADAAQAEWEKTLPKDASPAAVSWTPAKPTDLRSENGATMTQLPDHSVLVTERNANKDVYEVKLSPGELKQITGVRLEALPDVNLHGNGPGRSENGNFVLTGVQIGVAKDKSKSEKPLTISSASASFTQRTFNIESTFSAKHAPGWAIFPEAGKSHEAIFELASPVKMEADARVVVTLEFKSVFQQHTLGHFRLSLTDGASPAKAGTSHGLSSIFATPAEKRTADQKARVRDYFRKSVWPDGRVLLEQLGEAKKAKDAVEKAVPSTMVMQEMAKPRDTFILMRGQYDKPGEKVTPGTPAFLPPLPKDAPANRLGLARWIVDRKNPLTARVTVNRYWQMIFGTGIVKTTEDFGSQGELPSHPELLDYLAAEFMDGARASSPASGAKAGEEARASGGWDVRALLRLYVTSSTYRQASTITPELLAKDPENRLLARGTRYRLSAEMIRDQALAAAGLLDSRVGGASVEPYQPPGLWEELMSRGDGAKWTAQVYVQSHGADLYRRTMYTFWKRTCPPPTLITFDAPDRETCTVRRARTNTPLQALVLMNDPTYVEASRKLAERALKELPSDAGIEQRITFAFREVLARAPKPQEIAVLADLLKKQQAKFAQDKAAAENLLKVGESQSDPKLDSAELASWATMCGVILNLDEAVTRG